MRWIILFSAIAVSEELTVLSYGPSLAEIGLDCRSVIRSLIRPESPINTAFQRYETLREYYQ
jgi:hypothetical protein